MEEIQDWEKKLDDLTAEVQKIEKQVSEMQLPSAEERQAFEARFKARIEAFKKWKETPKGKAFMADMADYERRLKQHKATKK